MYQWLSLIYTWDFIVSVTITKIYMRFQCISDYHQYIPEISVFQWLAISDGLSVLGFYRWRSYTNIYLRFQCFSDYRHQWWFLYSWFWLRQFNITWDFSVSVTIVISDGFSTPGFDWGSLILPEISVYQWLSSSVMVSLLLVLTEVV